MATIRKTTAANLGITINGKTVYSTITGIKLGARGLVLDLAKMFDDAGRATFGIDKGTARRLRKALHRAGRTDLVMVTL